MEKRKYYITRKIYIEHYGPIPREPDGRSYDIHHIDGDHTNNSPENIKAVTIQEHYDIHYAQGDWAACNAIAMRMNVTPEIISELATKGAYERLENGTHHFLDSEKQRKITLKRIAEGTHNFLGGELQRKRLIEGTHHNLTNHICPQCGKTGQGPGMFRWHYENCRNVST